MSGRLVHFGRDGKRMERRRRRQRPFQPARAFPYLLVRFLALADALDDDPDEQQLADPEDKTADAGNHVPLGKLHGVIRDTARHPRQPQEVLREEQHVDRDHRKPEVELAQLLVIHVAGPLGQPEIGAGHQGKQCAGDQHVVKMRDDKIGVVVLEVRRGDPQHQPGETRRWKTGSQRKAQTASGSQTSWRRATWWQSS